MTAGADIARVVAVHDLLRLQGVPAGLGLYVRILQSDGDAPTLDEIARLAETTADAFQVLADEASQAALAVEARGRTEP